MRICDHCAGGIPASKPRNAKYCSPKCQRAAAKQRQRDSRPALSAVVVPPADNAPAAPAPVDADPLVSAVRAELTTTGRIDTILGQQALAIAGRMHTAAATALAALSKELRTVMAEATKGANATMDPIDELKLRRDRKSG